MKFELSAERKELVATARGWAQRHFGSPVLRRLRAGEAMELDRFWTEMAEFGWLGIAIPERAGGTGGELLDACLVAEQLARYLVPLPYAGNAILAGGLLAAESALDDHLQRLVTGGRTYSLVLGSDLTFPVTTPEALAWEWADGSGLLRWDGAWQVDDGPGDPVTFEDLTRSVAAVPNSSGRRPPGHVVQRALDFADLAVASCLVGTMQAAADLAIAHVRSRRQFGRQIGSFQAIQHMCADMHVDVETSRTILYGAAWRLANDDSHAASKSVAAAKAWTAATSRRVCETAVQLHGGMGYTWECDAHLYLRAALAGAASFGGEARALETVDNLCAYSFLPDGGPAPARPNYNA